MQHIANLTAWCEAWVSLMSHGAILETIGNDDMDGEGFELGGES
jgi:hypothetical protein